MTPSNYEVARKVISIARKFAQENFKKAMDNSISDAVFEEVLTEIEKQLRSSRKAARTLAGKK
jgi:hypothetical protein